MGRWRRCANAIGATAVELSGPTPRCRLKPLARRIQVGIRNFKPTLRKAAERHEAIEAYLAIHAGVSPEAVDEFDGAYEAKRKADD